MKLNVARVSVLGPGCSDFRLVCKIQNQLELSKVYNMITLIWWTQQGSDLK